MKNTMALLTRKLAAQHSPHHRWAVWQYATVVALIAIGGLIVWQPVAQAVGPLFGYGFVSGIGFVPLKDVRVLLAPTTQFHEGAVLTVTQLVTSPEGTRIWYELEGIGSSNDNPITDSVYMEDADGHRFLPTGETVHVAQARDTGRITVVQTFAPLPPETKTIVFHVEPDWSVPLELRPANEIADATVIVYPDACEEKGQAKLCVTMAAFAPEGTYIVVQGESLMPDTFRFNGGLSDSGAGIPADEIELVDDQGHIVARTSLPNTLSNFEISIQENAEGTLQFVEVLTFEPVADSAVAVTLYIPTIWGQISERSVQLTELTVDLGDSPEVGDRYEIDLHLSIQGVDVIFDRARISGAYQEVMLELTGYPVTGLNSQNIDLLEIRVPESQPGNSRRSTFVSDVSAMTGDLVMAFDIQKDDGTLQGGIHRFMAVVVKVDLGSIGPFEISWQIPSGWGK